MNWINKKLVNCFDFFHWIGHLRKQQNGEVFSSFYALSLKGNLSESHWVKHPKITNWFWSSTFIQSTKISIIQSMKISQEIWYIVEKYGWSAI